MKDNEKQIKEAATNLKQQVQVKPGGENLTEADLDKVAGGGIAVGDSLGIAKPPVLINK